MFSSLLGFLLLLGAVAIAVGERTNTEINYFDLHAAMIIVGGVVGSLLLAVHGQTCVLMAKHWFLTVIGLDPAQNAAKRLKAETLAMETAWREDRRSEVLSMVDGNVSREIQVAAASLIQHVSPARLIERFESLRVDCANELTPQIEGWDMVARLGPSFGIVGTVAGMVQLFRNMANSSGNLGGAMALALLATLYGILVGAAIGGPMSTRANQMLNERLNLIDLLERHVSALIDEGRTTQTSRRAETLV